MVNLLNRQIQTLRRTGSETVMDSPGARPVEEGKVNTYNLGKVVLHRGTFKALKEQPDETTK